MHHKKFVDTAGNNCCVCTSFLSGCRNANDWGPELRYEAALEEDMLCKRHRSMLDQYKTHVERIRRDNRLHRSK